MTEVRFYHLTTKSLDTALPEILEKVYERGQRALVMGPDDKAVKHLNERLWHYKPESFLPHGTKDDGHEEAQPIFLTTEEDNHNKADILILTDGAVSSKVADYQLCCEMLNGHNKDQLKAARERWKKYKDEGYELTYWKQDERGRWQKKDI